MLQIQLFVKKKSSSFTPMQESLNANPKLDISKVRKRAKKALFGGHLGLLVDSQSSQPTYQEDELKSPYCGAVICKASFENPVINNVVVISRNMAVYYRIKVLCTNATKNFFVFYSEHHRDGYDRTDRDLSSETEESYERSLQQPNLLDLVAILKPLDPLDIGIY